MRELLLFRHGKSERHAGINDYCRPLKDRGKRDAQRMGVWLLQNNLLPDSILSSPAERAVVSAEKACKAMGLGTAAIIRDERIYQADLDTLLQVLRDSPPNASRLMLVGHNPGLEELLACMDNQSLPGPDSEKLLPTAALAHLFLDCTWDTVTAGCATFKALIEPGMLPERFPYPTPGGAERRDRPAYYYTQSSVVPYRVEGEKLEILLVSSSKQKHWVVPKGIKDPGLTPQESAAKEAKEEAGVEGVVGEKAIGRYVYEKWGAQCTVDVFPMKVTRVIPDELWEESHRGREWVPLQQAAERVKQAELEPIILGLPALL